MTGITDLLVQSSQLVNRKSPAILTAVAVSGTVSTAYLAAKGSFKAAKMLEDLDEDATFEEQAKHVWTCYIPAGASGVGTIGAILMSHHVSTRRTAAAVGAYSVTEKAFSEYREKVIEEVGKHKEQVIRDEIAQDEVAKNPPNSGVIIAGAGEVLCCELYTKRYFMCDHETLRRAQNEVNHDVINHLYVTLDTFYEKVGLAFTTQSCELGWTSDQLLELKFSTVRSEDGRPCLAFDYNYVKPL